MIALKQFIEKNINTDYKGDWRAIYFEPIPASGERITIGVAACGFDNEFTVQRTVSTRLLRCMYGTDLYEGVDSIVALALKAIKEQLEKGIRLEECRALFTGIYFGEVHTASTSEFRGVVKQGIQSSSSFAELDALEEPIDDETSQIRWANQVRGEIKQYDEQNLSKYLSRKLTLGNRTVRFDVAKNRYIANFASIPMSNMGDYKGARSKMMDLENLSMKSDKGAFDLELIVGLPYQESSLSISSKAKSRMLETMAILKEDAESRDITCFFSHSPAIAAEHVMRHLM